MRRRAGFVVLVHRTVESVGRTLVATLGERASRETLLLGGGLGFDRNTKPHRYFAYSVRRTVHSLGNLFQRFGGPGKFDHATVIFKRPTLWHLAQDPSL